MKEIRIKRETPPERCEICHQSDCFDAQNNSCSRCQDVFELSLLVFNQPTNSTVLFNNRHRSQKLVLKILICLLTLFAWPTLRALRRVRALNNMKQVRKHRPGRWNGRP